MAQPDINNPATLIDEDGLPMTPFAIEELRHARIRELNSMRERYRLRRANQKKGFDEPKVGQTYHVQLDGSVTRRSRGSDPAFPGVPGVRFERNKRVTVTVVSDEEYGEIKARDRDAPVVTVHGADRILEDDALHVFETPVTDLDLDTLVQERDDARAALEQQQQENARLQQAIAAMKARREAPESTDGRPTKLPAQAAAKATAQTSAPTSPAGKPAAAQGPGGKSPAAPPAAPGNDFGGPADPEHK
jgi:hypothetical protein